MENPKIETTEVIELWKFAYWPSIRAKRLNITEMDKVGDWVNDFDNIGGILQYTKAGNSQAKKRNSLFKILDYWF